MCGIAGILDQRSAGGADAALVRKMTRVLFHRGPDSEGFFQWPQSAPQVAFGVRRLSILDLDTGAQPIFNEDRSIAIVFNGEIYNYVELRSVLEKQGHTFRTRSDTETVVHLYEQYGLDLFKHLRGMYAFAIWDSRNARLILAVDHIGIKPLYLAQHNGTLLFASEAKALFTDPQLPRAMNLDVLDTYLTFGYMIGQDTLYQGIRRLMPGHALVVEGEKAQVLQHWKTHYSAASERVKDEQTIVRESRELLNDSVRLHLRSDVPLGLFLSGGIDSASVLALMSANASSPAMTFSVGYHSGGGAPDPNDETRHARQVAAHFHADHQELILSADDWWNSLPAYVYHHDEPNANSSAVSLQALASFTAHHVKVVLTGLGGDELFCGYPSHRHFVSLIQRATSPDRFSLSELFLRLTGWGERYYPAMRRVRYAGALPAHLAQWRTSILPLEEGLRFTASHEGMIFSEGLRRRLYAPSLIEVWQHAQHKERAYSEILQSAWTEDPGDTAQALNFHTWLPGNGLLSMDKVTMAHSLEARVPFFDPVLMDFAMRIPSEIRLKLNKYVLRQAMRNDLPAFALRRPKRAFETPIARWFDNELAARIQAVLLDERCLSRGLFDRTALETLIRSHFRRRTEQVEVVFRLLLLELWQQSTIDAQPHGVS